MLAIERIAALAAGERNIIKDVILLFIPFTFIRYSFGTICGINAFTAGVCTPVPAERMSNTIKVTKYFYILLKIKSLKLTSQSL